MKHLKMFLIPAIVLTTTSCVNIRSTTKYNFDNNKYYISLDNKTNLIDKQFLNSKNLTIENNDLTIFNANVREIFNIENFNYKIWKTNLNLIKERLQKLTNKNTLQEFSEYYSNIKLEEINNLLLNINKETKIDILDLKEIETLTKNEWMDKWVNKYKNVKQNMTLYFYLNALKLNYFLLWNSKVIFSYLVLIEEFLNFKSSVSTHFNNENIENIEQMLEDLIVNSKFNIKAYEFNNLINQVLTKNIYTDFEINTNDNEVFINLVIDTSTTNKNYDIFNSLLWINNMYNNNFLSIINYFYNRNISEIEYFNNALSKYENIKEILIKNDFDFNINNNFYIKIFNILISKEKNELNKY